MNAVLSLFVAWPLLALVPAAMLLALARVRRSGMALAAGLCWAAYAPYEWAMHARLLCSGECNIRIDLLLIYPLLAIASVVAVVAALRRRAP